MTDAPITKILGREDFLSANNLKRELVPVPELGGSVWLRELGTTQLFIFNDKYEKLKEGNDKINFRGSIELMTLALSLSLCDDNGELLYTEADLPTLMQNKIPLLLELSTKALDMSNLTIDLSNGLKGEATDNLKNGKMTSLSSVSPKSFTKRKRR